MSVSSLPCSLYRYANKHKHHTSTPTHAHTNRNIRTGARAGGTRHFISYSTLIFHSGLPNTQPTVTIATLQRATGSQRANHVITTSVRKHKHITCILMQHQISTLSQKYMRQCIWSHRLKKSSLPLLMVHPGT